MHVTRVPAETALIDRLAAGFPRSPLQYNARHESDAELLRLPGTETVLALTIDGIADEIDAGLYRDAYLVGWMTVIASASDLAAVGAAPLGVLVSETLPHGFGPQQVAELQRGITEACRAAELPVLGGDTNRGVRLETTACAVGLIRSGPPLTRVGCAPGDRLLASGALGLGAAFALLALRGDASAAARLKYQPRPRIREGQLLRGVATCCMDTSDGALTTLDELMRLNGLGCRIERPVAELLHPEARRVAEAAGIPPWMLLAAPHGEFELVFTVPADRAAGFQAAARSHGWDPLDLGSVVLAPGLELAVEGCRTIDTRRVRDLFAEAGGSVERYIAELYRMGGVPRSIQATPG